MRRALRDITAEIEPMVTLAPGDVVLDIGANVGVYSLVAAKKPGGAARVFSFEASYASNRFNDLIYVPTAEEVASTERTYAFRDIKPALPVHVLIVPREHIVSADTVEADHADVLAEHQGPALTRIEP